jgi:uncharacterized protein (TIGR02145 family)
MKKAIIFALIIFVKSINGFTQSIKIGEQIWTTKNLDVSEFRNGDPIPQALNWQEWRNASDNAKPAWCYYNFANTNAEKHGKLYNWYAVSDSRGIAPIGWHVPNIDEWMILRDYLGVNEYCDAMKSSNGWQYKETSTVCKNCADWNEEYKSKVPCHICKDTRKVIDVCQNGSNSSFFSAMPSGYLNGSLKSFEMINEFAEWWSSSRFSATTSRTFNFNTCCGALVKPNTHNSGIAVRLVKDQ